MTVNEHRHFVGIGAQKAGTSWLHAQLALHPQIALPARKEIHYFDTVTDDRTPGNHGTQFIKAARNAIRKGNRSNAQSMLDILELNFRPPAAYLEYLARTETSETRATGDITPSYACLTANGFQFMRRVMNPKVIFIMRDPVARYWSAIRMTTPDDNALDKAFENGIRHGGHWARSDYETTIRLVDQTFDSEDVLYLFYEELMSEESLQRIAAFLGVDPQWPYKVDQVVREGRRRPMPDVPPEVAKKLAPVYSFVRDRFGDQVPHAWREPQVAS